jgi:hypothetical protein
MITAEPALLRKSLEKSRFLPGKAKKNRKVKTS